jgi:hypothetical protein
LRNTQLANKYVNDYFEKKDAPALPPGSADNGSPAEARTASPGGPQRSGAKRRAAEEPRSGLHAARSGGYLLDFSPQYNELMNWFRLGTIVLLLIFASLPACDCGSKPMGMTGDGGGTGDAATCATMCTTGDVCRFGVCVPTPASCNANSDCLGDTYCDVADHECLPWGIGPGGQSDPMCTRTTTPGVFFPGVQCEWLGPPAGDPYPDHKNVLSTPMVVDFGGAADPELSRPSIVFVSYNFTDGGAQSCEGTDPSYFGVIRVIDGRTCEQQASIAMPTIIASSSVALGDLTGDGRPEIVAARTGGGLAAWTADGMGGYQLLWQTTSNFAAGACDWSGPQIHDLDDDGIPEVVFYGAVYDAMGNTLDEHLGLLPYNNGIIPIVADVDRDGIPELVTGDQLYSWDAATKQWAPKRAIGARGQIAVADLGTYPMDPTMDDRTHTDGYAEIVSISAGTAYVYNLYGRLLFSSILPGGGTGGPPTIADFDGDGRAEFASAGGSDYTVFDLDCLGTAGTPATCASGRTDGILWSDPSQDLSSNVTGSSVFDFEGDGAAEAVYGDECFTRVYNGTTGEVKYSRYRTSCTWYENPIVADVDADYNAELVVTSNTNCAVSCPAVDPIFDGVKCFDQADCPSSTTCGREAPGDALGRCRCTMDSDCGGDGFVCLDPIAGPSAAGKVCRASNPGPATAFGVRVLADTLDRWVNTRRVWNQHAYSVTNVDEGGNIPKTSNWARNWDVPGLNNFRQNAPGDGVGAALSPDLTVKDATVMCTASGMATVMIDVCNRGTEPVGDGVNVAVYAGKPPTAPVACVATTTMHLLPGNCQQVSCTWNGVPGSAVDSSVVADDDGTGKGANTECREDNNSFVVRGVSCP